MKTIGIVCEYNPFHNGHQKQIRLIREKFGPDTRIVCLMSGNYVQRGAPAVFDKSLRAQAAVNCGADVVLEMPVTVSLSSAEGFAAGSVEILGKMCDILCFGSETADADALLSVARMLRTEAFSAYLRKYLSSGVSFPTARCAAVRDLGADAAVLEKPNDILAVEYCKAVLSMEKPMAVWPIHREGDYHATDADSQNPSATALRRKIESGEPWFSYIPEDAVSAFENAAVHTWQAGERAVLCRLRTMTEEAFACVPHGSEGLWRKLMHESRCCSSLEEIACAVKSKRYTRTRIDRMILCTFLGLQQRDMGILPPKIRVLAFSDRGMQVLKDFRKEGCFCHTGEKTTDFWWELDKRCDDLYGLFCADGVEPAGITPKRRVYIKRPD